MIPRPRAGRLWLLLAAAAAAATLAAPGARGQQQQAQQAPAQQPKPQQRQQVPCSSLPPGSPPALYGYQVVAEYPHDPKAFTQGLVFAQHCDAAGKDCKDGFFESTGIYGESDVRAVDLVTGAVRARRRLGPNYFGEGLARLNGTLHQLTWQGPTGFSWAADAATLAPRGSFRTPLKDGWGAAADGQLVVLSDGSDVLTWVDPANGWRRVKSVQVRAGNRAVSNLNELEVIGGEVWANVWQTDCIARVCRATGQVTGWLLLSGLKRAGWGGADVLNGIAWDAPRRRLFVTGKYWSRLFELRLTRLDANAAANQRLAEACLKPPFEGW